jgi:hypothetical protein
MKKVGIIIAVLLGFIVVSTILRGCDDAAKTVNKEFNASALLKKYEDFKNLSAAIDEKRAVIEMYQSEIQEMSQNKSMDKEDKFYYQQRKSELLGIISIHNQLCAQYNSAMSKFNYRFTNRGDLPETNLEPLPREIKPYINNLNSK